MPLNKRTPFVPNPIPTDLKPDEQVFYLKITNEIFRNFDDYFNRVIMCNSLVWTCSVTGKINLTFEEAVESERQAQNSLSSFTRDLKRALLFLVNQTQRGRIGDVVEDIFSYSKEHYFVGETVLAVVGKLWCLCRVVEVIPPTQHEIEEYRKEQEGKGELDKNDYLKDNTWGPPPELFHYMVVESDPDDPNDNEPQRKEAIDVKREKLSITKEKCRYLVKAGAYYDENALVWRVRDDVSLSLGINEIVFDGGIFVGDVPLFEKSLGPPKAKAKKERSRSTLPSSVKDSLSQPPPPPPKKKAGSLPNGHSSSSLKNPILEKKEKPLSPEEEKLRELERKAKEREKQKDEKKLIADFRKLWLKPKEDLEVEDHQELPVGDPVDCKIPTDLFGDFLMVLEYLNSFSSLLHVKDFFPQGLSFDTLQRALLKDEIAGPLSDILQVLLKGIFGFQEREDAEITQEEKAAVELSLEENAEDVSAVEAIEQATAAATWSLMYQSTPLYRLPLDHLTLTEVLRLHLLSSGARATGKDIKWRLQMRGGYSHKEDPGLDFRLEEPQVLKTLVHGTVFDLELREKLKLLQCLIHQILTYADLRDAVDQSCDLFKETRLEIRTLQAAERRSENEDNLWRMRLKTDRVVPDEKFMKAPQTPTAVSEKTRLLSDEEIEGYLNKRQRETLRRKETFEWKVGELSESLYKHERKIGIHPIGRDRAYRRYWVFSALPGLFVEDDDWEKGSCLPSPTPHLKNVDIQDITFVKEHFKRLQLTDSELHPYALASNKLSKVLGAPSSAEAESLRICSGGGESSNCSVHSRAPSSRTKWSFFSREDQVEELINSLSPRGVREKELRQAIIDEAAGLRDQIKKCPFQKLNIHRPYAESGEKKKTTSSGKNALDPNLSFPVNTPVPTILELQLRDLILETEEKIFLGTLGSLKVKDRNVWTKAIEGRGYDPQTSSLHWGQGSSLSDFPQEASSFASRSSNTLTDERVIRNLASAILQLEQSVEPKFLKRPLGSEKDEGEKKKKGSGDSNQLRANWVNGTPLERWETSLMKSTTFSQLFIHILTLDRSISWNRSVLNARCRICRRKGDAENMLLCDGCNKGHHAYCFKPPLEEIPKGDWFCSDCKPAELPPRLPRRRGKDAEESGESEGEEGSNDEDESMPVLEEETNEFCIVCGCVGEVICCDGCPALYHLHCLNPPKQRVPRGLWYCDSCIESGKKKEKKVKKARSKPNSYQSEESEEEEGEEEEETTPQDTDDEDDKVSAPIKVRIGKSPRKHQASLLPPPSEDEDSETEELKELGRGTKRKSAYKAELKISQAAKRLRSDSKENESSESSTESISGQRKQSLSHDSDGDGSTQPKRTRLQRMHTNRCGDSGDLDNVLLDKLILDLMHHTEAWPFLKPVTRAEAPDYHDIVLNPMDLGTIKYKLNSMVYTCNQEFLGDLHLVFENCFTYNDPSAPVYKAGQAFEAFCKRRCEKAGLHFGDPD